MLTLLVLSVIGVMVFTGVIAIPLFLIGALFWLITLPFRLFFGLFGLMFGLFFGMIRMAFGIVGGVLGLLFAPIAVVVLGVLLVGGLIAGLVSLLAPLVPLALLALLGWAIYRIGSRRSSPTF